MSRPLRPQLATALILALMVALAACGASPQGQRPAVVSPTSSILADMTPSPSAVPTVTPGYEPCAQELESQHDVTRVGDLILQPAFSDPDSILFQLPDGTPLRPLKVPAQTSTGQYPGWPTSTLDGSPIYAAVCNGSATTAHTVQGARVKLVAFTPYTAALSEWDFCSGYYARPAGVTPENCDRGSAPMDEGLQATFAGNAQPGTIVTATQTLPNNSTFGPLPAVLPPGVVMYLYIGLTAPTAPGTYTFAASITADGSQLPFTGGTSMLIAPVAHVWNGQACTSAGMLAQIPPATNPPTPYICPTS